MMYPVLVLSAAPGFAELIQITLQDDGRYDPFCLGRAEQALAAAQHNQFAVAIVDSDVTDLPIVETVKTLRQLNPGMKLVMIPPGNDLNHPDVAALQPDGCLTKPFYIPDLARLLNRLLKPVVEVPEPATPPPPAETPAPVSKPVSEPIPEWLQDVNRAAQHLTRLSLESAAHAALIVRQGQLWAYAGDLPQNAAQELAQQIGRYWEGTRPGQSDLARFIHLDANDSDYMLYATSLAGNMALALAFNVATPFTKMRTQAADLARALADGLSKRKPTDPTISTPAAESKPLPVVPPGISTLSEEGLPPLPPDDEEIPMLDLGDVPPPIPRRSKKPPTIPWIGEPPREPEWERPASPSTLPPSLSPAFDLNSLPEAMPPDVAPRVAAPAAANEWIPEPAHEQPPHTPVSPAVATPAPAEKRKLDTRPLRFEPPSPTVCSLSFACVLVPRLPQHHLIGELADHLPDIMQQACLVFGWRLEHMAVRPDYLQWLVSVPPSTSASYLMRILRHQLSERLFEKFPKLAGENPSGDFWAPGYLIMSSHQLPPPNIVSDYVAKTRQYQGLNHFLENNP
jgi:REP element-mobilizing transposase RayT/CheY-like chemotaxis protein